jgi:transposase
MDLAGYVIKAVLVEGRNVRDVAAAHGLSKSWVYELLARRVRRDALSRFPLVTDSVTDQAK